jgi:hypothetical protein
MKKLVLLLMILVWSQIVVLAEPESVVTGNYNVSFDMGFPKGDYNITIDSPKQQEDLSGDITTSYLIKIENRSEMGLCWIGLSESNSMLGSASPETLALTAKTELDQSLDATNIEIAKRIIDGSNGAIAAGDMEVLGETIKVYNAMYNVKTGPNPRHLVCSIISNFPWEEGTLSLLKTIHIVKVKATA